MSFSIFGNIAISSLKHVGYGTISTMNYTNFTSYLCHFVTCLEEKKHSMEEVPNERWKMISHCHHAHLWSWQVISFCFSLLKVIVFGFLFRKLLLLILARCEEEEEA
jgi:hypothetical protein